MNARTNFVARTTRLASAWIALALALPLSFSANAVLIGPSTYSSFATDSPFRPGAGFVFTGGYFFLETFDDHSLMAGVSPNPGSGNTGSVASAAGTIAVTDGPPVRRIDQVGLPGGCPVPAPGACDTWFFASNTPQTLSFVFNPAVLDPSGANRLPNVVGIVVTDNNPGTSLAVTALSTTNSILGQFFVAAFGDPFLNGTTDEDRFFGVFVPSGPGIARIEIGSTGGALELDDLQFGFGIQQVVEPPPPPPPPPPGGVPEPASLALLGLGLAGLWLARRKTRTN